MLALSPRFLRLAVTRDLRIDGSLHTLILGVKGYGARGHQQRGAQRFLGVNLVLRGTGRYQDAAGRVEALSPGTLFHRYPQVDHATWFDGGSDFAECFVCIDPRTAGHLQALGLIAATPVVPVGVDARVIAQFEALATFLALPETERSARSALEAGVTFITGLYERGRIARRRSRWEGIIEDACYLLEHDLSVREPIAAIAARLGVRYAVFRKRFTAATGYPPAEYRIRRRLESAQHGLQGGLSVAEVAQDLGYSDAFALSHQFTAYIGLSPRAYQRRTRGQPLLVRLIASSPGRGPIA